MTDPLATAVASWGDAAGDLEWDEPWRDVFTADGQFGSWFPGGRLNLAVNCVDRHLTERGDSPAILWEGEPGDRRTLSFRQLHAEVCALTGALRALGVGRGDRLALHLGWLPETVVAMLACARLGAVHTVLPTPLPAEALSERLEDFSPKVLFTQDGAWRHGAILPLKSRADEALSAVGAVQHTVVVRRTGVDVAWYEGDRWLHDLVAAARPGGESADTSPVSVPADHHLLSTHLPNRRGRPVAAVHGTANLLVAASAIHRYALSGGGVFWCAGDLAWLGAQAHGVYGPLAWGDPAVMFEGMLDVPTRTRAWEIVARHEVATMVTSPSVIRRLRGWSHQPPAAHDIASLGRVVTLGEAVDPGLQTWVRDSVGRGRIGVADGWGQVELGGIVLVDRPVDPSRLPDPGLDLVAPDGRPVSSGRTGELVLRHPWAGTLRALEGAGASDAGRHWSRHTAVYATGDRAARRPDGGLAFLGRLDEIVSISGQLVSLSEVRDVLLEHPFVVAADVVERVDARLGQSLVAAVVLSDGVAGDVKTAHDLLDTVREVMGGLARPRALLFVDRFGEEVDLATRRRAITALASAVDEEPAHVTWTQVLAAARAEPPLSSM